jgi:hypothetical protein
MKTKKAALLCALIAIALCAGNQLFAETELSVSVKPGKNWETTSWVGVFPMKHTPQIAVWLEDSEGTFVKTLTVSGKSAKNKWIGDSDGGRPEALPVWRHKALPVAGGVDAASSATPKKGIEIEKRSQDLSDGAEYAVFFEINTSFDYNESWPKGAKKGTANWSGVNGQPSVVYSARFVAGRASTVQLSPVGTGSIDGSDGTILPGFEGLTSALSLVESVTLTIK